MRLDTLTESKIRECLVEVIDPIRIVIFGSFARGTADADSDIDIAAITNNGKNTRDDLIRSRVALRDALKGTGLAIDFILQSIEQFELSRQQKGSVQEVIAKEGLVIFERQ